ncbi:hypothetical protein [Nonomuraea sp. NPDC049141]|uniref:hypothetical protein n=1 Tax=unclassified Nonomuraea TaxID=2593643 RepID=UPI0033C97DD9
MTANHPIVCPTCQGVIVSSQASYTPARGRLIVTNGYCQGQCSSPEPTPEHVEHAEQLPARQGAQ